MLQTLRTTQKILSIHPTGHNDGTCAPFPVNNSEEYDRRLKQSDYLLVWSLEE